MPRYFFHVYRGSDQSDLDSEGGECADLTVVREEALSTARHLLSEGMLAGKDRLHWRFEITDEAGHTVLTVPFSEAVERDGGIAAA